MLSRDALRDGRIDLNPDDPALHAHLQCLGHGQHAVDLARLVWGDTATVPALLQHHGSRFLQRHGDQLRLRPDRLRPGRELLHWRAVSLALPPVMLAATIAPIARVTLLDRALTPSGPVAQLHVHANAAYSFDLLWSHLAARAERNELPWREFAERPELPRPPGLRPPYGFTPAAWAQLLHLAFALRGSLRDVLGGRSPSASDPLDAIPDALEGRAPAHALFAPLGGGRLCGDPKTIAEVWERDPAYAGCACPEVHLLHEAFERAPTDPDLALRLTQYLRLVTLVWRSLVQAPADAGLPAFAEYFSRISPMASGLKALIPEVLADEAPLDLRAVEPRMGIPKNLARAANVLRGLPGPCEWGWVFHLFRCDGAPATNTGARREPRWSRSWMDHREALKRLCDAVTVAPSLLQEIRGLDLASVERREPLWIAAGLIADVRDAVRKLPGHPLGLTLHVGEDFRHLASGLRAVAEPFVWELIERGDRLGHALALGLDIEHWAGEHPRARLPRWERLLDLLWMWSGAERHACTLDHIAANREIHDLEHAIWPDLPPVGATALAGLWRRLGHPCLLRVDLGYPITDREPDDPCLQRLHRLLWDPATFSRADRIIEVETAPDVPVLCAMRAALLEEIARWQVAIEINPSSNLLVAGLRRAVDQPMFRIRPIQPNEPGAIPVVLCSDDPLSFSTRLADEYAYAWAGMAEEIAPSYVRAWLEEAAAASFRHRFTLPRTAS